MSGLPVLRTERLLLRPWRDSDLPEFAAHNADPEVRAYFPGTLSRQDSDASAARICGHAERFGYGLWAVEIRGIAEFAGFIGLMNVGFEAHFTPAVEIGWRLGRRYWGCGYATEGARAALDFGFGAIGLNEIVSMTPPANRRSWAVMERIGMTRDPADDFDVPDVPDGPLKRHLLYRIKRADWKT
ncbi:MAG TPA: GNAT family N-acetyltransferase [Alphaproteobacteria bacterium]|nr:GNAT family N-acetyltransferase [Alphaproteobacteria bacterium]